MRPVIFGPAVPGAQTYVEDISTRISGGVSFSTRVPGLYYQLEFSIDGTISALMDIYQNWLGNRIVVFDDYGGIAWDGLIWSMEIDFGGVSLGPRDLDFIANYVAVEYSDVLNSNNYALTSYASDIDSQAIYGIKEEVLPYGSMTSSAAAKALSRYISDHKQPFTGGTFAFPPAGDSVSLRITALGFWATTRYRKFQSIITTTTTVKTRIQEIVNRTVTPAAPGTSYYLQAFSTDVGLIDGTNLVIARANLHVDSIGSYLEHIVSLGSDSNQVFYIGAEHGNWNGELPLGAPRVRVWGRPTAPEFYCDIATGLVRDNAGQIISPFRIRAGTFVAVTGLSPNANYLNTLDQIRGFIVSETSYDDSRGIISMKPEGTDQGIEMILARMRG